MKRWLAAWLGLMLLAGCARAQSSATMYTLADGLHGYFACEDYVGEAPADAAHMFDGLLRKGDEVLCGTVFEEHDRREGGIPARGGALMAVKREGRILLLSARREGGAWRAGIESDDFLPPDAEFSITTVPDGSLNAHLAIIYQGVTYEMRTTYDGGAYLHEYSWTDDRGETRRMDCYGSTFRLRADQRDPYRIFGEADGIPVRLCAWTAERLPKTEAELIACQRENLLSLRADEAYISGVNLREQATGDSPSWGKYTAKVRVLGQKPGKMAPWHHVQLGNLQGWVSGLYLHRDGPDNDLRIYEAATKVYPVGCALRETALLSMPEGKTAAALPEGALVHVLMEKDGWLHVIVPRGALSWQTDWDGTYGFVKAEDMDVGISRADVMRK